MIEHARDLAAQVLVEVGELVLLEGQADDVVLIDLHLTAGLANGVTDLLGLLHGETAIVDQEEAVGLLEGSVGLLEHFDIGLGWHMGCTSSFEPSGTRAALHIAASRKAKTPAAQQTGVQRMQSL